MINELKNRFGGKCSGINVNGVAKAINIPSKQLKFCEAVNYSFDVPIQVNSDNLGCPGAKRSVGFDKKEQKLAAFISENTKIPALFIKGAFNNIPRLKTHVKHINLGITEDTEELLPPDLFIMYVHPAKITEIMHLLAKHNMQPSIPTYSLLSVCGNVFANSYVNKVVSISFGCPESRKYGGVEENKVIIGIPRKYVKYLTE